MLSMKGKWQLGYAAECNYNLSVITSVLVNHVEMCVLGCITCGQELFYDNWPIPGQLANRILVFMTATFYFRVSSGLVSVVFHCHF